jgi:hypothetical protein
MHLKKNGLVLYTQGDLPTAVLYYRASVAVNPFHADAWTNRESPLVALMVLIFFDKDFDVE